MTFDKSTLKSDIKSLMEKSKKQTEESMEGFADDLANAIEKYVKKAFETAKVKVIAMSGEINVAGSAAAQANAAPITITGNPNAGGGLS